jgi:hypothetical protein
MRIEPELSNPITQELDRELTNWKEPEEEPEEEDE